MLGIISGSIWGSFQGWGSFRGRDRSGSFRELYIAMTSNPKSLRTTGNEAAKVSVPFSNLRSGVILFYFFFYFFGSRRKKRHKGIIGRGLGERA